MWFACCLFWNLPLPLPTGLWSIRGAGGKMMMVTIWSLWSTPWWWLVTILAMITFSFICKDFAIKTKKLMILILSIAMVMVIMMVSMIWADCHSGYSLAYYQDRSALVTNQGRQTHPRTSAMMMMMMMMVNTSMALVAVKDESAVQSSL